MDPRISAAILLATHIGVAWWFYGAGQDAEVASRAHDDSVRQQTIDAAQQGAAKAIAQLEIKHVTIRQQADTVVREVPVYRECRHDQRMLDAINAALSGAEPPGAGQLPRAGASGR